MKKETFKLGPSLVTGLLNREHHKVLYGIQFILKESKLIILYMDVSIHSVLRLDATAKKRCDRKLFKLKKFSIK